MLKEFNCHIGNPSIFAIGFQRTNIATRIYVGIKGRVWIGMFSLTNFNDLDWTDDSELQEHLLKNNKDFRDLTQDELRHFQWGWLEEVD
jgi:hypothetical protein